MKNIGRVGLILVLAVLADGTAALAQGYAYYNRLTNVRQDATPLSSLGIPVARSGTRSAVTKTVRQSNQRLLIVLGKGIVSLGQTRTPP